MRNDDKKTDTQVKLVNNETNDCIDINTPNSSRSSTPTLDKFCDDKTNVKSIENDNSKRSN